MIPTLKHSDTPRRMSCSLPTISEMDEWLQELFNAMDSLENQSLWGFFEYSRPKNWFIAFLKGFFASVCMGTCLYSICADNFPSIKDHMSSRSTRSLGSTRMEKQATTGAMGLSRHSMHRTSANSAPDLAMQSSPWLPLCVRSSIVYV